MSIIDSIKGLLGKKGKGPAVKIDKAMLLEKIRQADLFKDIPAANMEEMFSHMETVAKAQGETIITEGEEGDYYYLMVSGTADVSRSPSPGAPPETVAQLDEPKGFGEEALISNAKRNATITMTSDGAVMRLSKDNFNEYVKEPLVTWFSPKESESKVADGAKWIDVREDEDAEKNTLHGAISMPLCDLRARMEELSKDVTYICYCENGRLSSTGAFLLKLHGYNVGVLRGGLQSLKRAGIA